MITVKNEPKTWDSLSDILTAQEVADFLQLSVSTVKRMCKDGEISAKKIKAGWRVDINDLKRFMLHNEKRALLIDIIDSAEQVSSDIHLAAELIETSIQGKQELADRLYQLAEKIAELKYGVAKGGII